MDQRWWQSATVYQIYPRSFRDTSGDGVGDLPGILSRLDHLEDLGVDAVWLSPVYPSPMADAGYDVSDYCDVDPVFGSLDELDVLIEALHDRDMRLLLDWVPNHTSSEHPWFVESRSSRDDPKRDWYIWRDPAPGGGPPNNWIESLTFGPAWTLDETTGQYYLHCFLPEQPDLNWANPEVRAAMADTLRFWMDRGVDGFRMDVVHLIGKDPELADTPPEVAGLPQVVLNQRPETHEYLRELRTAIDAYPGDRMAIGEVFLLDAEAIAAHFGDGDELHLCFNFPPLHAPWAASDWRHHIRTTVSSHEPRGATPTWVLSNHDVARHRTRYGGDERIARAAAVLIAGLGGTWFVYAGEELGLEDAVVTPEQQHDPAGRDGCRAPIPWEPVAPHGWTDATPWLPWPPDAATRNPEVQGDDPGSMMSLYRQLIRLRRDPALIEGGIEVVDTGSADRAEVVEVVRRSDDATWRVIANMSDADTRVDSGGSLRLSSDPARPVDVDFAGRLGAFEAVIVDGAAG